METFFTEDEMMSVNADLINCLTSAEIIDKDFVNKLNELAPEIANCELLRYLNETKFSANLEEIIGADLFVKETLPEKSFSPIISKSFILKNKILPLAIKNGDLVVAAADPFEVEAFDELSRISRKNIAIKLASFLDMRRLLEITIYNKDDVALEPAEVSPQNIYTAIQEVATLDRFFAKILESAIKERASDIHFEMNRTGMRVRFRVDGRLNIVQNVDGVVARAVIAKIKLDTSAKVDETRMPQDKRIRYRIFENFYDLRVSILPTVYGENIAVRIFDQEDNDFDLRNIGLDGSQKNLLEKIISFNNGLILLCGPTGCGKTTTLYTILKQISSPEKKVVTIEDPIEYRLAGINQVPVNDEIGLSFATILRSVLRQSPNIIMVGEIRDNETAELAIQAALTGHLVFSTVHCSDSVGAITRLLDFGITEHLIRSCLRGAVSQRLLRKPCKNCMKLRKFSKSESELFPDLYKTVKNLPELCGCEQCSNRGYKGRTAAFDFTVHKSFVDEKDFKENDLILENFCHVEPFTSSITRLLKKNDVLFDDAKQLLLFDK